MPDGGYEHSSNRLDPDLIIFDRVLTRARRDTRRPLCHCLGLTPGDLAALARRHPVLPPPAPDREIGDGPGPDSPEEPDLRALLLEHAAHHPVPRSETRWLAAIVARACQQSNHLWQDLGLDHRDQLSDLLLRHFPTLALANTRHMKWKKFFYRQLCDREGIPTCPAPQCARCSDRGLCFEPET